MHDSQTSDEWINELDQGAWEAWVGGAWLHSNPQGLQGESVGKAREEAKASKEEAWRKSTIPQRKAWI